MKSKVLFECIGSILCALCLTTLPVTGMAAEISLKLGHCAPPGKTVHDVSAKKLAERVAANTGGRVEIKVFGGSQFGSIPEHMGQVKSGAIDLFVEDVSAAFMVEPKPKNMIIMLFPYLFESQEHYHRFCRSDLFKSMMGRVEKEGNVKFLSRLGDRPPRCFATVNRRVTTPEEIKGLKLRVPSVPPFVAAYKAWGANPTPVVAKEMYSALKSGIVDGMDVTVDVLYGNKFYELQKYYIKINYMRAGIGAWMNANKWESLPEDIKAAFLVSAQETQSYVDKFTAEYIVEAEKAVTEAGVEIIRPDLKPWMDLSEKEVRKNDGNLWEKGLYDKIKALK